MRRAYFPDEEPEETFTRWSEETRDYVGRSCENCGQEGHRRTACPSTGTISGVHPTGQPHSVQRKPER